MYYHFCRFAVWFAEFTLAIAEAAPTNNKKYVGELRDELWYWRGELDRAEVNHVAR